VRRKRNVQDDPEIATLRGGIVTERERTAAATVETNVWRARAERLRGENDILREEITILRRDLTTLADKFVTTTANLYEQFSSRQPDIPSILEQFRRTITPDIVIPASDAGDEQRSGIRWDDQGLDNMGGTPASIRDMFDSPTAIPDYVLDVESLTPNDVKGSRGGWYNPSTGRPQ